MTLQKAIRGFLDAEGDADRARQQQAYMKSTMPYAGVTAPVLRKQVKQHCKAKPYPDGDAWQAEILKLWREARVREERHAAIELLSHNAFRKAWLTPSRLPMLRELVVTGAWWDYVDPIAIHNIGFLLREFREELDPILYDWATDDDLWIRRSAILAQLKFKTDTDEALLFFAIEHSWHDTDFFARKAIGWALREYSKTSPQTVRDFVERNAAELSPLSKREALRLLDK